MVSVDQQHYASSSTTTSKSIENVDVDNRPPLPLDTTTAGSPSPFLEPRAHEGLHSATIKSWQYGEEEDLPLPFDDTVVSGADKEGANVKVEVDHNPLNIGSFYDSSKNEWALYPSQSQPRRHEEEGGEGEHGGGSTEPRESSPKNY